MPPLPESRYEAPMAVIDGTLLVFGGFTGVLESTSRVFALEPGGSHWQERGAMPIAASHFAVTTDGTTVWFAGGFVGDHPGAATAEVWSYDSLNDTWASGPALPEPRASGALVRLGRNLHYVGGVQADRDTDSGNHWVLPLGGEAWESLADISRRRNHLAGVELDGKMYLIGGQYNHDSTELSPLDVAAVDVYDPVTESLSPAASLPTGRSHMEYSTFVLDGRIVVVGGRTRRADLADIIAYDPELDRWLQLPRLPNALRSALARAVGDRLVVVGGGRFEVQAQDAVWSAPLEPIRDRLRAARGGPAQEDVRGAGSSSPSVIAFESLPLHGESSVHPTTLQFGPDGRLYVGQQDGTIQIYTVNRDGSGEYNVTDTEVLDLVRQIPNHNDDGSPSDLEGRLLTGLLVTGTAETPLIYVTSSDPRISQEEDSGVDTNSGMVSRLELRNGSWIRDDLVRGLPRGKRDHASNGLVLDRKGNQLLVAQGGHTNLGAPSRLFLDQPEYALSGAILAIDLEAIGDGPYDLPTLDDEDRPNRADGTDVGDPFGGNNGQNQATLTAKQPVLIHSPGWRNPYDLVLTRSGHLFTVDNGANAGWGGAPIVSSDAECSNESRSRGATDRDNLHLIAERGYYGGHPNPTRGSVLNTFNGDPAAPYPVPAASPVPVSNPVECVYRTPGRGDGALATLPASTNGLAEYTASFFDGELAGDLLGAAWDGNIYRFDLDPTGERLVAPPQPLLSGFGAKPLDITVTSDDHPFPGTIWAAVYGTGSIQVFEPVEGLRCDLTDTLDDPDGDGFSTGDELANATDPCSGASRPSDFDGDGLADGSDPDDDGDGLADTLDPFALDYLNGRITQPPVHLGFAEEEDLGGLLSLGFTGLMTNGRTDYRQAFDPEFMTAGGAGGLLTLDSVDAGSARGSTNSQKGALQFGLAIDRASGPVIVRSRIECPCLGPETGSGQAIGMFVGTGTQDDYVAILVDAAPDGLGLRLVQENAGRVSEDRFQAAIPEVGSVTLELELDPFAGTLLPAFRFGDGKQRNLGRPVALAIDSPLHRALTGPPVLAVGVLATSHGGQPFAATWDLIEATFVDDLQRLTVPGTEEGTRALRLNAGGGGYIEPGTGHVWYADRFFERGAAFEQLLNLEIEGTRHPDLYRSERFGNREGDGTFSYRIPVWEPGIYRVSLHLAEIFFGTPGAPPAAADQRVFSVVAEDGAAGIAKIDLASEGPPLRASTRAFEVTVEDGTLDLEFRATANYPKLSALEIIGPLAPGEE